MKWHPCYRDSLIYSRVFNDMVSLLPGFSHVQPCVQWNGIPVSSYHFIEHTAVYERIPVTRTSFNWTHRCIWDNSYFIKHTAVYERIPVTGIPFHWKRGCISENPGNWDTISLDRWLLIWESKVTKIPFTGVNERIPVTGMSFHRTHGCWYENRGK